MKTPARPRRTSGAGSDTTTFEIKVVDQARVELRRQIDASKRITRKLRDLPELARRFDIEAPGVSLPQPRDRLLKGKSAANKAIAKHDTLSKRQIRPLPGRNPSPVIIERAQLSLAEMLARQQQRVTGHWRDWLPPSTCPTVNGRAAPFLSRTGATLPGLNSINHDSTAGYLVDQQSDLTGELSYLVAAWRNDDASAWRDDNPDCVFWYENLCIVLPALQCDSTVVASLSIRFTGSITSEADDHNEIRQCLYVAHSDENGILPP